MKLKVKCETCHVAMVPTVATKEHPYHDVNIGLDNIWLVGVTVLTCPKCGAQFLVIPRIEGLFRTIAVTLLKKRGPLRGDEIRFLRKHAEFPAQDFAALLGVTPSHLSRIENGKTPKLGTAADRLARMVAKAYISGSVDLASFKQLAGETLAENKEESTGQLDLFLRNNRWHAERRAA